MFDRKLALIALGAALLAACNGDDGNDAAMAPQTVMSVVNDEIASNTTESAVPIMINDLAVSDDGTDETSAPLPI